MSAPAGAPPDQAARDLVRDALDRTLFVEAGAGSGKTTALVGRVLALVVGGHAELRSIAAITFTEKAGAELRDRLRRRLEETAATAEDPVVVDRCRAAVDQLDGAAIGTLHSFAQRILSENPVEAELPPRIEVLDEVRSEVEFERRWGTFRDALLADPALERTILLMLSAGVRPDALRVLAVEFDRNWDLVAELVPAEREDPPDITELLEDALAPMQAVCDQLVHCTGDDKLADFIENIATWLEEVRAISDETDLLEAIHVKRRVKLAPGVIGKGANWAIEDLKAFKDEIRACGSGLDDLLLRVTDACAHRIGSAIRAFTIQAAEERRRAGRLMFHDLLVLARRLVTDEQHGPAVRRRLAERYTRLLLDEFQDTDPIQVELAVRIAAADPEPSPAAWHEVPVEPGRLFMVGDPKQSIYRFRRADIALFLDVQRRFGVEQGGLVELTANFRTVTPIVQWVNRTFAALMGEAAAEDPDQRSQATYIDLLPTRAPVEVGPPVSVLAPTSLGKATAAELRRVEAEEVVAAVARAVTEGWTVRDEVAEREAEARGEPPGERFRPCRLGDITILVPARTSLPFLENELSRQQIAYRAESSSLVYATRAVRDLLLALRAVDDPTDELAIVATLRSPIFGCGDDDLYRFRQERGGRFDYLRDQPETMPADDPVARALAALRGFHVDRHWSSPSELLDRIARDRRLFELGFAEDRPRDVWRRLRYVIDQARGWSEATGGSLRDYLHWVGRQTAEGARVAESVLPETDDDAVRIMTIHAAKGLEFPITILSGMSTAPQHRWASAEVAFPPGGSVAYRFGKNVRTDNFDDWAFLDEQMGLHERIRLLYVACTRAKDHLVVSLCRKDPPKTATPQGRTNAELLIEGMGELLEDLPIASGDLAGWVGGAVTSPPTAPAPLAAWREELAAALYVAARPTTVAATALTDTGDPDVEVDDETAIGPDDGLARDGVVDADRLAEDPGPVPPGEVVVAELPFGDIVEVAPVAPAEPEPEEVAIGRADDGLRKRPRDLDLPPWLKGRYGTAVGRAVHGVLQTIDLATGAGLAGAVAAQCEAEAIVDRHAVVEGLVADALASPLVRDASAAPHWREVYACAPIGGDRLLEGYVDLLFRSDAGLVVVDYKTAATDDPEELARRVDGYRHQGASYALAVARTTGEPVVRVAFLFLTPTGAVTIDLPDIEQAAAEVERLVTEGAERVTS